MELEPSLQQFLGNVNWIRVISVSGSYGTLSN